MLRRVSLHHNALHRLCGIHLRNDLLDSEHEVQTFSMGLSSGACVALLRVMLSGTRTLFEPAMAAGTVEDEDGMRPFGDRAGDLGEVDVYCQRVGIGHDQRGGGPRLGQTALTIEAEV